MISKRKVAIINIADTGACETTTLMLQAVGYDCYRPGPELLHQIRWEAKCEGCYSVEELVKDWGYEPPFLNTLATVDTVKECDLFVDVKAHVNYQGIVKRWPNLQNRVLWCCLNGGDPMKREDRRWADPPCPVLTNNMWYGGDRAYACYPLYARLNERNRTGMDGAPICLVHNVARWGYGNLVETFRALGGKCYGGGEAPDGLIPHRKAMQLLSASRCMVHLKNGDTVGYAVVEAMASAVPVICTQQYINDTKLHDLLEPGHTCFIFDGVEELTVVMEFFNNPQLNAKIGEAGRDRLRQVMWNPHNKEHLDGWEGFLERNFK